MKMQQKSWSVDDNDPIFTLPPYKVEQVYVAMSETIDWGLSLLDIPALWRQTKGEGIKVAVLDTGIATNHIDLRDSIFKAKDFSGSKKSSYTDVQGHGTHVAGTIAARENSTGVIGVAPKCQLLIGKVLGDNGSGSSTSVANGINWAVSEGADIISMSLGSPQSSNAIKKAVKNATAAGVFIIAAAGNEGPKLNTVGYPGKYKETISVGSIDRRRGISKFSSRGIEVDIVAPGDQILSTYPPNNLARLSGTSMATPFVSGVVALMLAKKRKYGTELPINSVDDLRAALKRTATDAGAVGRDDHFGFGIIDPAQLLNQITGTEPEPGNGGNVKLHLSNLDLSPAGRIKVEKFLADNSELNGKITTSGNGEINIKL